MNSRLAPTDSFPDDLAALTDIDLQVLHSRIQCQLDHEYAHDVEANPETEFRHAEIREEIEQREFSTSAWQPLVRLTAGR
jgi:hypothetical protein